MKLKLSILNKFLYVEREDGLILGTNLSSDDKNSVEIDTNGYFALQANMFLDSIQKEPEPEPFSEKYESMLYHNMKKGWQDFMKEEEEKAKEESKFAEKATQFYSKMLTDSKLYKNNISKTELSPSVIKPLHKEMEEVVFEKKSEIENAIKKAKVEASEAK